MGPGVVIWSKSAITETLKSGHFWKLDKISDSMQKKISSISYLEQIWRSFIYREFKEIRKLHHFPQNFMICCATFKNALQF